MLCLYGFGILSKPDFVVLVDAGVVKIKSPVSECHLLTKNIIFFWISQDLMMPSRIYR